MRFRDLLDQELKRDGEFARLWDESEASFKAAVLLVKLRARHGLTQSQLADKSGVKRAHIARIESGMANPTVQTLSKILAGVGASLDLEPREPDAATRQAWLTIGTSGVAASDSAQLIIGNLPGVPDRELAALARSTESDARLPALAVAKADWRQVGEIGKERGVA